MSRSEGFAVMDVSTDIVNDPKFRKLQRLTVDRPDRLSGAFMVYVAMLAESWKAGKRVNYDEAWPAILPFDKEIPTLLREAGLMDGAACIPTKTWNSWFKPANTRREATRERWRKANEKRHESSTNNSGPTAQIPRGNSVGTVAIPNRTEPSVPIPTEPSERDALDRFYELTQWNPWSLEWRREELVALQNDYGIPATIAALDAEWSANKDKKTLTKGAAARLARDTDRAKEAARLERKPKPRIVVDDAERARVAAELGRPA